MGLATPALANVRVPLPCDPAWWAQIGVLGPDCLGPALASNRSVSCRGRQWDPHLRSYFGMQAGPTHLKNAFFPMCVPKGLPLL